MSDTTSQFWLWLILIFSIFILSSSAEQKNIPAESGQDITLPCRAPNNNIIVLEWSRTDLEPAYVLLYRDGHFERCDQHPSFKNRVDLQDRRLKDGDVSLVLKNVTVNDAGTYECRVFRRETKKKRANLSADPISIINLRVVPPGPTGGVRQDGGNEDGSVGLIVGLTVSVGLLLGVVVGILIYIRCRKRQPPDDRQLDSCSLQTCEETLLEKVP